MLALLTLLSALSAAEESAATQACAYVAHSYLMYPDENPVIDGVWTCVMHGDFSPPGVYYLVPMWAPVIPVYVPEYPNDLVYL